MSQRIRSSKKWQHLFHALTTANQAIGGEQAKQFHIADSESFDAERWFSPGAIDEDKANARQLMDRGFAGDDHDLLIDRGDAYWNGPRDYLTVEEQARRRAILAEVYKTLNL